MRLCENGKSVLLLNCSGASLNLTMSQRPVNLNGVYYIYKLVRAL